MKRVGHFELEFKPDTSEENLLLVPAIGEDGGGVRPAAATADEMSVEHRDPGSTPDLSEHKVDGRQSNGRKQDDMKRSAFLDPSFVKSHLRTFFHGGDNLKKYCTSNGIISNYNALRKYANEINIIQLKDYGSDIDVEPLLDGLFEKKTEERSKTMKDLCDYNKYLTLDDEQMVTATIGQLAYFRAAVSHADAKQFLHLLIQQDAPDGVELDPPSDRYVSKVMKLDNLKTNAKISSVDIKRMKAANADTLHAFMLKADSSIKILNALGRCEYTCFADIPADNIFNADEFGSDAAKNYDGKIIPKEVFQAGKRIFQYSPQGDNGRQEFHTTVMQTSCANGTYAWPEKGIVGAPPPFIVHANPSANKVEGELMKVPTKYQVNLVRPTRDGKLEGVHGVKVYVSKNRSMEREMFKEFAIHFFKYTRHVQGPVFLLLDGHTSRWNWDAQLYLYHNNVYVIILPSHSSTFGQPNDRGVNRKLHNCIKRAVASWETKKGCGYTSFKPKDWNEIFIQAYQMFIREEHQKLAISDSNATTESYRITSIHPFDPTGSDGWQEAIDTIGARNHIATDSAPRISYEPVPRTTKDAVSEEDDGILLMAITPCEGVDPPECGFMAAHQLMLYMIGRWHSSQGGENPMEKPTPMNRAENIALYYWQFATSDTEDIRSTAPLSAEEFRIQRKTRIFTSIKVGQVLKIK